MNPPKRPDLKLIQGTARPDREKETASLEKAGPDIPPPSTLDIFGRARWRELVAQYSDAGLLDKVDQIGLEALCMSYQRGRAYRRDEKRAERERKRWEFALRVATMAQDLIQMKIATKCIEQAVAALQAARYNQRAEAQVTRQYLQEFGATPGSKRRLPQATAPKKDKLQELIEKNLKKKTAG